MRKEQCLYWMHMIEQKKREFIWIIMRKRGKYYMANKWTEEEIKIVDEKFITPPKKFYAQDAEKNLSLLKEVHRVK